MKKIRFNATRLLTLTFFLACFVLNSAAHAESLEDINRLIKQGQNAHALEQLDSYIAANPKDAQGRFLKGVLLTEMNRTNEAILVFNKLTEDYPELPEPYNNLAVIYAQQNQYDKARQALEMAIRTHPSYATAHENLGDIYARMASEAYDKALQLDSSNTSAQKKLALIRSLAATSPKKAKSGQPVEPPAAAPEPAAPKPVAVTKPATGETAGAPGQAAIPAITQTIDAWMAAWSHKDMPAYFAAYAKNFKTPDGGPLAAWQAERRKRIAKPGKISIHYEDLRISVDGDTATAKFRQYYASGALKSSANKVLHLLLQDGKWLIQQERIGS